MNHEFWYLSRAAGFTAYLLLFVSVALGISMGTRLVERFIKRNVIFDLHRFTTLLALAFTLLHVYVLLLDGFFQFNVWDLSIPFLSPYRSWQTAVGIFAMYALVLVITSFYIRRLIGYRAWRALHFTTFAMFAAAALHGIAAGTDTTEPWAKAIYVVTSAATIALILYRIQYRVPDSTTVRALRLGAGIATVIVAALLLFATSLFRSVATNGPGDAVAAASVATRSTVNGAPNLATNVSPSPQSFPFLASFGSNFTGTYAQSRDTTSSHLTMDGATTGDFSAKLHLELAQVLAVPTPDNEVDENDPNDDEAAEAKPVPAVVLNVAEFTDPTTAAALCTGQLTSLQSSTIRATCSGAGPYSGVRMNITSQVRTSNDGTFTGALSGTMQRLS